MSDTTVHIQCPYAYRALLCPLWFVGKCSTCPVKKEAEQSVSSTTAYVFEHDCYVDDSTGVMNCNSCPYKVGCTFLRKRSIYQLPSCHIEPYVSYWYRFKVKP